MQFQDDEGENFIILYNVDDGKQIGRLTFSFLNDWSAEFGQKIL